MRLRFCLYLVLFLVLSLPASAQFFYFGQNKVQYTKFDWHVLKTDHFDIYYYPEMKDLAERGAYLAEESYKVLQDRFNHNIQERIPLIFYSSHIHFEQTNVSPEFIPEGIGGFFEFLKGRVVIPYDGSMWDFRHVIRHELVHVFMYSKINRVLLDHRQREDRLPPLWFVEGLAEFWSSEWDDQAEMVIRDAVMSNYLVPLSDMDRIFGTFLMYKEGQNLLQFLSQRYGEEKILLLMENFWKSNSFNDIFKYTIGRNYKEFDEAWVYALKKQYYPLLSTADEPGGVTKALVRDGFNSKPVYYSDSLTKEIYFIGNRIGSTGIYRLSLSEPRAEPISVVEGDKTSEFEAFHLFQSKMDISKKGMLAFVTKSGETDAIHIYDVKKGDQVVSYHFKDLVVIGSASWSPDDKRMVFSAVDKSGNNDLYLWDTELENLTRLTNDPYDDRDPSWSPDGKVIVFSSDRSSYGIHGKYNLFIYNLEQRNISYLTCSNDIYSSPAWSPDGNALLFTCDAGGARNIWMMKFDSSLETPHTMKRLTSFTTAAFDPVWAKDTMIFTAFENFSFQLRELRDVYGLYDTSTTIQQIDSVPHDIPWTPATIAGSTEQQSLKYKGDYSLDIAASEISTDPVFGTAGGAFLSLSDLLGNEQYYFLVYNTAQTSDELLSSFNLAISRISLQHRTNYAYGVYRFSGRRYDIMVDPDNYFYETDFGGYFALSYPISRFRRLETVTSLSNSERELLTDIVPRQALFLSNSISYIHDNSLWGPSGPLDGSRFMLTLSYTSDIQYSNANYYSAIFDYRRYIYIGGRSAYASRYWLFYNDGKEARRFFMGGNWDLRGYPRFSLRGRKLWLTSHELRFPFLDQLGFRFPFGGVTFVGLRGALFFDAGNAWDDIYGQTLGSTGFGVRLNLGGFLVLRYDMGKRIENNFTTLESDLFSQFFFGWDF
ncbi:MAG: hypothetical protein ACHQQQ_12210 [Bacteroidota bacterium]